LTQWNRSNRSQRFFSERTWARRQGARFERQQAEFADALRRIADREDGRGLGRDPGRESGERGEEVVDRGRRLPLLHHRLLPGEDVAAQAGGDPIVVVAFEKEADEAVEVEGDLLRNFLRTNPDHSECQIPGRPRCQAVRDIPEQANGNRLHLSGSEIREIGKGFR
jgi:hypothetical protein